MPGMMRTRRAWAFSLFLTLVATFDNGLNRTPKKLSVGTWGPRSSLTCWTWTSLGASPRTSSQRCEVPLRSPCAPWLPPRACLGPKKVTTWESIPQFRSLLYLFWGASLQGILDIFLREVPLSSLQMMKPLGLFEAFAVGIRVQGHRRRRNEVLLSRILGGSLNICNKNFRDTRNICVVTTQGRSPTESEPGIALLRL